MAVSMRRSARRRPYGTIAVLLVLAIGLAWTLIPLARGEPIPRPLGFLRQVFAGERTPSRPADPAPGKVRVFTSGRPIPAYAKVTRDDLWNAAEGTWSHTDVDESLVESGGVLKDAGDIVGRVLARRKAPGYVFTEDDLFPEGTREGLAAGVPAGKRALRIEVGKVEGIVGLQPGDRFDIVAAVPMDPTGNLSDYPFAGIYSEQMSLQNRLSTYRQARVKVLVQNGVVVTPLETRLVPITNSSLTRGTATRTIPVQEMVIALIPEEVAPFMEALSVEADVTCLARSGRPDDPLDSVTPSSDPGLPLWGPFGTPGSILPAGDRSGSGSMAVIESIAGEKRQLVPVPSRPIGEEEDR